MADQKVQHGDQPAVNPEVQHGTQPATEATVNVHPNGGIVADFQGGDPVPEQPEQPDTEPVTEPDTEPDTEPEQTPAEPEQPDTAQG